MFQEDQTDSSSCESDRTENCFRDEGSVTRVMSRDRDRVMSRDRDKQVTELHQILGQEDRGMVPVYWSASQLLSKLDHRQPIRSEYGVTATNERPLNDGGERQRQRQHFQGQQYAANRSVQRQLGDNIVRTCTKTPSPQPSPNNI